VQARARRWTPRSGAPRRRLCEHPTAPPSCTRGRAPPPQVRKILCWHWEHTRHGRFGTYLEMLLQQASLLTPPAVHTGRDAHAEDEDDDDTASLESFVSNTSAGTITPATDFFCESQRQGFRVGDRSRGRFATPADFPLHDYSACSHVHVRRESLGFVHRSRAIFCPPAKP
jgi:hypothetical protein